VLAFTNFFQLEKQVTELWQAHETRMSGGDLVPAELVGNEHLRWGYL
jgi:hypothetical protein